MFETKKGKIIKCDIFAYNVMSRNKTQIFTCDLVKQQFFFSFYLSVFESSLFNSHQFIIGNNILNTVSPSYVLELDSSFSDLFIHAHTEPNYSHTTQMCLINSCFIFIDIFRCAQVAVATAATTTTKLSAHKHTKWYDKNGNADIIGQ